MRFDYLQDRNEKLSQREMGFRVIPILENCVDEFEDVANNETVKTLISAYRQLSASLDLINVVSDQLVQEWQENRPDIDCGLYNLSGGLVAEQLNIPGLPQWDTVAIENDRWTALFLWRNGQSKTSFQSGLQWLGRKRTRLGNES